MRVTRIILTPANRPRKYAIFSYRVIQSTSYAEATVQNMVWYGDAPVRDDDAGKLWHDNDTTMFDLLSQLMNERAASGRPSPR